MKEEHNIRCETISPLVMMVSYQNLVSHIAGIDEEGLKAAKEKLIKDLIIKFPPRISFIRIDEVMYYCKTRDIDYNSQMGAFLCTIG